MLPRARTFAKFVAGLLPDCAVSVYTLASDENANFWVARAVVGEAAIHEEAITAESGLLGTLLTESVPVLRSAPDLKREDYPHIDTRKTRAVAGVHPFDSPRKSDWSVGDTCVRRGEFERRR